MRVIINILSEPVAILAGWRAKAVQVNDKTEATLIDALKATRLKDGSSMYDLIADEDKLKTSWRLYVDGHYLPASSSIKKTVKDNVQIHVQGSPPGKERDF